MGTAIADYRFEDFDQMAGTWRALGWGAEYGQLRPGRFQGRLLCSTVGSSKILRGRWGGRIRHQGLQPKGTVSLAPTLSSQGQGRFMGVPIGRDDVIVQASRTPFELAGAPVWDAAVLELPESAVAHEVAALTQRDPWPIVEHQGLAHLDPQTGARVRAACRSYVAAVERHQPGREQEARLAGMARDLASLVIGAVADTRIDPVPTPRASRAREIGRGFRRRLPGWIAERRSYMSRDRGKRTIAPPRLPTTPRHQPRGVSEGTAPEPRPQEAPRERSRRDAGQAGRLRPWLLAPRPVLSRLPGVLRRATVADARLRSGSRVLSRRAG